MKYAITPLLLICFLTSCTTMDEIHQASYFTKITYEKCGQPSDQMYLFYEGEKLDFKFKKVGLLTVQGEERLSKDQVLDRFKYAAWDNCANGIIFINYSKNSVELNRPYPIPVHIFEGMAVQIELDDTFRQKYGEESNMEFLTHIYEWEDEATKQAEKVRRATGEFWVFVLSIGLIVLGAL